MSYVKKTTGGVKLTPTPPAGIGLRIVNIPIVFQLFLTMNRAEHSQVVEKVFNTSHPSIMDIEAKEKIF